MIRTTAALAASATLFALLLTGCGDDKATTDAASSSTTAQSSGDTQVVDNVKAGAFVVSFRGAFPKLADGKDDAKISTVLSDTCKDIKAGKPEDEVVKNIVKRASGKTEATTEESKAIYQMAKMMC
ncbi:hypothetical protein NBRGN_107_00380 [Nocardia brasiliensis NBRC 14402]|uniref:hypothetical protein n=1 Tax=Nocardia brasiliensis TaxID=37326 RepID=UPI0002D9FE72|nr:hypothetical protein [Nocardia brasiliensis]ASF08944.1 hypothetical protein CEQ30_17990 [Nocardia brasiliensis]GAJ86244.1 hypothetical protein NBRGN_107_00380 [Nocardia brasiliensis NBRC 14402]SUB40460.1 Uncharacterised protein [Nocardia brasiliensis]